MNDDLTKLHRGLSFLDVFCLASGAMISSGIFILPGIAYLQAGPLVFLSYFLAGIIALFGTFSVIELSTAMPKAGGDYFFITRSLGPFVGTVSSFLSWTALCLKSAFAIFGIAEIIYLSFGVPLMISAFFLCCFFTLLNIIGVKQAASFETVLVICLFGIMVILGFVGLSRISLANFKPLLPHGFNKVLATAGFVFISFGGLLNIASVSGEIKEPSRNIPRAMILSLLAVTAIYTLILIVVVGILPHQDLSSSMTPIADTGRILLGNTGYFLVSIAALLAFITTANAGILSASRYPLALSQDRLLPGLISKVSEKNKSPYIAIIITGIFIFLSMLLDLNTLVKLGSVVILTLYIMTNLAVIILREGKIQNYKPAFKVPFYPWINIIGIILFTLLIADMGFVAIEISLSLFVLASLIFFFYGRKRHNIEYALLHLLERVIDKSMTDNDLEEELKQIIIQRDQLKIDRFHNLADDAMILDIQEKLNYEDFLDYLCPKVCDDLNLDKEKVKELFKKREKEGSTAITSFVAIPHIIIPGKNRFKLVLVRAKKSISFSQDHDQVKAVFVLFGTKDERHFHLQVLSAIAQIVQNDNFEKSWLKAKTIDNLKDTILLGERNR